MEGSQPFVLGSNPGGSMFMELNKIKIEKDTVYFIIAAITISFILSLYIFWFEPLYILLGTIGIFVLSATCTYFYSSVN